MLRTFKAWLRDSRLEWIDEVPQLGGQSLQVQVTFLDEESVMEPQLRGKRMAEILEKLAATQIMGDVDPGQWQQEIRQDRSLPGR
ncbi:MAG: hypothetical protein NW224_22985 [Leptolyngbyaceae cyanobacterium bins.302]|nr:hypothetical protein [Leptolyngbyaceae cyanobacterium bins.302]